MTQKSDKSILQLISEAGVLKNIKRSGWWVLGIRDGETVAEHSFRCSVIGYALAHMEGVQPYKILLMTLFNDIHEARILDQHKMVQYYIDTDGAEDNAFGDQIENLPGEIKGEMALLRTEYRKQRSKASIIARDADILECLIQAKEYYEYGHKEARKFMKKAPRFLKTKSAKRLWLLAQKTELNSWWESLSNFKR